MPSRGLIYRRPAAREMARDRGQLCSYDAGEVIENLRGLTLGKLSPVKIDADRNATICGTRERLHDWPVRQDIGCHVDFMLGVIDKRHVDMF
jgi:hypothetical protein